MSQRNDWISITPGCLDARDIEFICLPAGVEVCPSCLGNGKYKQHYIEGRMTGRCDFCDANGFVYTSTAKPVPESVTNQIAVANNLNYRRYDIYGLDWSRP